MQHESSTLPRSLQHLADHVKDTVPLQRANTAVVEEITTCRRNHSCASVACGASDGGTKYNGENSGDDLAL